MNISCGWLGGLSLSPLLIGTIGRFVGCHGGGVGGHRGMVEGVSRMVIMWPCHLISFFFLEVSLGIIAWRLFHMDFPWHVWKVFITYGGGGQVLGSKLA